MKICPQCAKSYPDTEIFCEDDGAKLGNAGTAGGRVTTVMAEDEITAGPNPSGGECPVCGGKAQPGELICNFCGTRLGPEVSTSSTPGPATPSPTRPTPETFVPGNDRSSGFQTTPIDEASEEETGRSIWGTLGFIGAAVFALAAGGLFALYLSHRNKPAPIAQASPSPAAVTSPSVILAKTIPIQVSGDLAATLQRDPKDLAKAFADNNAALADLYRHDLESSPELSDGIILRLHILPDGSVSDASVRTSTAPNPSLDAEVVKLTSGWKFAPATGVGVDADYPVIFTTKDADVPAIETDLKTRLASLGPNTAAEYALSPATTPTPAEAAGSPAAAPSTGEAAIPPSPGAMPTTAGISSPTHHKHRRSASGLAAMPPHEEPLRERVTTALAGNRKLRRVQVYTTGGNVTLSGKVFDENDKLLAEQTVRGVSGVTSVTDNLGTDTAEWVRNASTINQQLQSAGLTGVTVKVIGKTAYLTGTVKTQPDKERAVAIAQSAARVIVRENLIRVEPGGLF
jgi:TonB family protein